MVTSPYQDLSEPDHVLFNLELSYDERDTTHYAELLDSSFVFFFSDADYSGGTTPVSWDRLDDLRAARHLLDPNSGSGATAIDLDLVYPEGNWIPVSPDDAQQFPNETWYVKTVAYSLTVDLEPDLTYMCVDLSAQFSIRQSENDQGATVWRIVRWRDIDFALHGSPSLRRSPSTAEVSWGLIKALFLPDRG